MAAATPLGNMVVKIELNDLEFGKGVENTKKKISYLSKEMQANARIAELSGSTLGKLSERHKGLSNIIQAQTALVKDTKKAYDESFVDGKATDSTKRLAVQLQDANSRLANYKQQLSLIPTEVDKYNNKMIALAGQTARSKAEIEGISGALGRFSDRSIKAGDNLMHLGRALSPAGDVLTRTVSIPLLAIGAAAIKSSIDYESAFAGVKKTVNEQVDANGRVTISYNDLSNGIRNMAKELPSSANEIAGVVEAAGQLGIKTGDLLSFSRTMIDLGVSTNMSADEAAVAIAKIANITGLQSDEYQRFGSSVTALGNNFATTEKDIIQMDNRLAAAGKLAHLSNQEMLGLSTAMSSVGIKAEAGGTAMTQTLTAIEMAASKGSTAFGEIDKRAQSVGLTFNDVSSAVSKGGNELKNVSAQMGLSNTELRKMYNDAGKASESLSKFAQVSGMSSEQFALTWKKKPVEALQAFLKGLGELDAKGESATLVLDEMGLKGIRQSNMLKALALSADKVSSAVDMSNKAWDSNTALTKEAGRRYETTESKLKMLKNQLTDVAIEFGGPLVDALRDGLDASKPALKFLGEMAKNFSALDKEQQQFRINLLLGAMAAGPFLKIIGGLATPIGTTAKNTGLLAKSLKDFLVVAAEKKAMTMAATGLSSVGTAAVTAGTGIAGAGVAAVTAGEGVVAGSAAATSGLGAMVAGLGSVAIPATVAVAVLGAVAFAAYKGTKAYEEHQLAGAKWGTEVTKEQDKVITKSYELGNKAKADVAAYTDGVKTAAKDAVKANNDIVDSIQKTIDKEAERRKNSAEKIDDPEARKRAEEYADYKTKLDQKVADSAKQTVGNINKIMADASQNNRNLSTEEKNYIAENYRQLSDEQLKAAGFNKDQRIAIESAYQNDLNKLSDKQLQDRSENVMKGLDKEKTFYDKQKSYLKEVYGEGTESYKKEMTNLNETNHKNTETMILGLARLTLAQGFSLENMSGAWEKYGWTTEEVAALVKNSSENSSKEAENLGNILKTMGRDWDSIKLDPKTGKVTVEGKEDLIQSLLETDKWKDLTLDEKKLLVNGDEARVEFLDTLFISKNWQNLTPEEKLLQVNGDEAKVKFYDAHSDVQKWNDYQVLSKEISIENRSAIGAIIDTEGGVAKWNALQPDEKELLAKNDSLLKNVLSSEQSLNEWRALPVEKKELLADSGKLYNVLSSSEENLNKWKEIPDPVKKIIGDNTSFIQNDMEAKAALDVWQNTPDAIKKLLGDNSNVLTAIFSSKENLDIWNRMPEEAKKLLGNNQNFLSSKEGATAELQNWANNNPPAKNLDANNRVGGPVDAANAKIVTLNGKTVYLDASNNVGTGVNSALQDLERLPKYRGVSIGLERVGGGERIAWDATGTNYHPGGHMVVNDQKGSLYKEIVQFPNREPFIPIGRNVFIPDAPIGTKVYRASRTKSIMQRAGIPNYANGIGIPEDSKLIKNLRSANNTWDSDLKVNFDNSKTIDKLDGILSLLSRILSKDSSVNLDGKKVGEIITKESNAINEKRRKMESEVYGL